jgi:hypothetical protein
VSGPDAFLTGAIAMASFVVALLFLRFWRGTRDRFFLLFATAFAVEGAGRSASAFLWLNDENPVLYAVRVMAYGLILVAILQKNRR